MNHTSSSRGVKLPTQAERRLGMAQRMPQLATARALMFMVCGFCLAFGLIAWLFDERETRHRVAAEVALRAPLDADSVTMARILNDSRDSQRLYVWIAIFGVIGLALAYRLYRFPLLAPVVVVVLFVSTFIAFLLLHHSDVPVYYVLGSFLMLAALIKAVYNGHLFQLSYARMGRRQER